MKNQVCIYCFLLLFFGNFSALFAQGATFAKPGPICAGSSQVVFLNANRDNSNMSNGKQVATVVIY